jgi:hypothetical protein
MAKQREKLKVLEIGFTLWSAFGFSALLCAGLLIFVHQPADQAKITSQSSVSGNGLRQDHRSGRLPEYRAANSSSASNSANTRNQDLASRQANPRKSDAAAKSSAAQRQQQALQVQTAKLQQAAEQRIKEATSLNQKQANERAIAAAQKQAEAAQQKDLVQKQRMALIGQAYFFAKMSSEPW